ncbi:MAG: hypothetical protein CMJ23_06250 [Phycisphaerae bacterium]|nr:hypothetical protein [Phycisphaerae bacterium]
MRFSEEASGLASASILRCRKTDLNQQNQITPVPVGTEVTGGERDDCSGVERTPRRSFAFCPRKLIHKGIRLPYEFDRPFAEEGSIFPDDSNQTARPSPLRSLRITVSFAEIVVSNQFDVWPEGRNCLIHRRKLFQSSAGKPHILRLFFTTNA